MYPVQNELLLVTGKIMLGVICLLLGFSFAWKCIQALLYGRLKYWEGFLPLTIISPLCIHLPEGKNSLIKTKTALWVHIIPVPVFLVLSLLLFAYGADCLGLPGCKALNFILTAGRHDAPWAVVNGAHGIYHFPILQQMQDALYKLLNLGIPGPGAS